MNYLPLSWECFVRVPYLNIKWLPLGRTHWITGAGFSDFISLQSFLEFLFQRNSFVIRGFPSELIDKLTGGQRYFTFQTGIQGWMEVQNYSVSSSLAALQLRAQRFGSVKEISNPSLFDRWWEKLWQHSVHARKAKLKHLFHTSISENHRLFVFQNDKNGEWMGAMSLSQNGESSWHVESMIRHSQAPVGTMDCIIQNVIGRLKRENVKRLSLGEVPFVGIQKPGWKQKLFLMAGRMISPLYNYKGLYSFKHKYVQCWEPVYVVSNKPIGLSILWDMFHMSRASLLALQSVFHFFSAPFSPFKRNNPFI